jgi:undecaprenyl diphosphate synthase
MRLAQDFFDADESVQKFFDSDVKLVLIGNITKLSPEFQSALKAAVEKTAGKEGMTVCLAVNYGGRDEIVRSIKRLQEQKLEMNEQNVNNNLDTRGIPDPDMIIRTGNQQRLSNFLLWQSSYSELYFSNIPWPDFSEAHLETAIRDFLGRKRTYGK